MELQEVLCRAWIDCDPNRGGKPGSGFHPDDPIEQPSRGGSGMKTELLPPTPLTGKPRWHWFIPRAAAFEAYLDRHGFMIVPKQ